MDVEPMDPAYISKVLSNPPFVIISGVHNSRDLASPERPIKPGHVFRTAELSSITEEGKSELRALGITTVFDLRSDTEIEKYNSPLPTIEGVEIIRTPVFQTGEYSPEKMAQRFQLYSRGQIEDFMILYSQILDHGGAAIGTILRHIRDKPSEGRLFHCTAGKDRTGVIAAIILKLADVDNAEISKDFSLTREGREPAREMVMARLAKEPIFAANKDAALNMLSCRAETMDAFLNLLEDPQGKYGGAKKYVLEKAGLSEDDINIIQKNLKSS